MEMSAIENEVSCPPWLAVATRLLAQCMRDLQAKRFPAGLLALLASIHHALPPSDLFMAFRVLHFPFDEKLFWGSTK
jgi:hypothetical protein